jgi:ribosome-associated protein
MPIDPNSALSGEEFARGCAQAAADKKAIDTVILDLRGISSFTDFFVICSGSSEPQIKAISSAVREYARETAGQKLFREDGFPAAQWIAVDFGEVIVHIFHEERRPVYDLESLWRDAPHLPLPK